MLFLGSTKHALVSELLHWTWLCSCASAPLRECSLQWPSKHFLWLSSSDCVSGYFGSHQSQWKLKHNLSDCTAGVYFRMRWSSPWNVLAVPAQLPALCRTMEGFCGDLAEMYLRHTPHQIQWIPTFADQSFKTWRINFLINIKDMRSHFWAHLTGQNEFTPQGKNATESRTGAVCPLIWQIQLNFYLHSWTLSF